MFKDNFRNLFDLDNYCFYDNGISEILLKNYDSFLLNNIENDNFSVEVYEVYKKFSSMKQDAPESMKINLFNTIRNFAKSQISLGKNIEALILYRFLFVKSELLSEDYYSVAEVLVNVNEFDLAKDFLEVYKQKEKNKPLLYISVANFCNLKLKDFKSAIEYYEKYIKIDSTKAMIYLTLGDLYSKVYEDLNSLKIQIKYFEMANKLKPNERMILQKLAFSYDKLGEKYLANVFYKKILEHNPTDTDYFNYGASLISCGDLVLGHKYLCHRFSTGDSNLSYPVKLQNDKRWDLESDISNKILLVYYEQGFGDTFMYCRFVPFLQGFARKIIFVVQDELVDLIKSSKIISERIEVISDKDDLSMVEYDLSMALLDIPYVLKTTVKDIPYCDKYLEVEEQKVLEFREKFLGEDDVFRIGISCHGDKNANYSERDVEMNCFDKLSQISNVKIYSLQTESKFQNPQIVNLGSTFSNFTDTACAIKNMDLVISTDNVILNLAGALGVRTVGIFTRQANFRWFNLEGENVGWYNSVKPFQIKSSEGDKFIVESEIIKIVKNYLKD